jgi:predicted transcriptional regulator
MASLYGIESEDDCRKKIDELLELHRRAEKAMNKESIAALKSQLKDYYERADDSRMSAVERACFWPAIQEAYVRSPNLARPQTWRDGLYEIELNLRYYRPKKK